MRSELIEILRSTARKFYNYTCAKCQVVGDTVQLDHIFPVSIWKERRFDPGNVQLLCADCNRIKGVNSSDYRSHQQQTHAVQMDFRNQFLSDVSIVIEHQKQLLTLARKLDAKK